MTRTYYQSDDSTVLVIGATGNLGSRLVRQLAAAGVKPRLLVRTPEKAKALALLATPFVSDLREPENLEPAFRGARRVFIVAPPVPEMEAIERNAIDAAVAGGAERIVYLSNFTAKEGSKMPPIHIHGLHERRVASLGLDWTVLGPTRYMTSFPFDWPSVLNDGLLLEVGGAGIMTCIDPDEVAEIAVKVLVEDGHTGKTYRLTSDDEFTASGLAVLLSKSLGREVKVFAGDEKRPPMNAKYFELVAAGLYQRTDVAAKVLGRAPRSYEDWLKINLPRIAGPK